MKILKEISELEEAQVITTETADKIRLFYSNKTNSSQTRMFTVFSTLGALLVGLGIILILAHNWDDLPRYLKTGLAILPLVMGQLCCMYVILKKTGSAAWSEGAATFLFCAIGSSISLVSQVYHIPGNFDTFLLTWMILALPLVYLLSSSMVSLLYIVGITVYTLDTNTKDFLSRDEYLYWILLLFMLPYYTRLILKKPAGNFTIFHHWLLPVSLMLALGTLAEKNDELLFVAFISLFGFFYLLGTGAAFTGLRTRSNGYFVYANVGTIAVLLGLSFDEFWSKLRWKVFHFSNILTSPEFAAVAVITIAAILLLVHKRKSSPMARVKPMEVIFIFFMLIYAIGMYTRISPVLINLLILSVGVWTIREGARLDHLGIMNYGLLIISALVVCRFFDTDLTFVTRGLLFVTVGIGFFLSNYLMLKKRKNYAS